VAGYRRAWQVLSLTGAPVISIPVDIHGLSTEYTEGVIDVEASGGQQIRNAHHGRD
jgi:DNA-binding transcriptional MocR family regulator